MDTGTTRKFSACLVGVTAAATIALATNWNDPPRFDGAGYAVLARSISQGRGYRAIDHPESPRHAHFPPGYPLALAGVETFAGESARVAHLVSLLCAVGATLAAHRWFVLLFGHRAGLAMGLALAINWAWIRVGGGIQSEPLFMLLGQLAILVAWRTRRRDDPTRSLVLGALLGSAILTRHAAIALALAVFMDLALARRWRNLTITSLTTAAIVVPWIVWMACVSTQSGGSTQADLLAGGGGLVARIGSQIVFYTQRIPDQLTGPFVEVATVFARSTVAIDFANLWAISATLVILIGWIRLIARPRRRLGGLIPLITLGLLLAWPFTEAGRFLVPLIPCLLIGGVEGIAWILRKLWGGHSPWVPHSPWVRRCSRTFCHFRLAASLLSLVASIPYSAFDLAKHRTQAPGDRDVDAACAWIAIQDRAVHPGRVLTRHPGEVFLRTGRQALDVSTSERAGARDADPDEVATTIARYRVAYLLIDDRRYANAPPSPLSRFVSAYPQRARRVWTGNTVSVFEVD